MLLASGKVTVTQGRSEGIRHCSEQKSRLRAWLDTARCRLGAEDYAAFASALRAVRQPKATNASVTVGGEPLDGEPSDMNRDCSANWAGNEGAMRELASILWRAEFPEGQHAHEVWLESFRDCLPESSRNIWPSYIAALLAAPSHATDVAVEQTQGNSVDSEGGAADVLDTKKDTCTEDTESIDPRRLESSLGSAQRQAEDVGRVIISEERICDNAAVQQSNLRADVITNDPDSIVGTSCGVRDFHMEIDGGVADIFRGSQSVFHSEDVMTGRRGGNAAAAHQDVIVDVAVEAGVAVDGSPTRSHALPTAPPPSSRKRLRSTSRSFASNSAITDGGALSTGIAVPTMSVGAAGCMAEKATVPGVPIAVTPSPPALPDVLAAFVAGQVAKTELSLPTARDDLPLCIVCRQLPKRPQVAAFCGHFACRACWDAWMVLKFECPVCRKKVRPNNLIELKGWGQDQV